MMRDKIAQIISDDVDAHLNSGIPWDGTKAADAIIAALPDMIPDLVWEDLSELHYRVLMAEEMPWRCESYTEGRWFLIWSDTLIQGEWDTAEQAKAVANAHHKAKVMAALGLEKA